MTITITITITMMIVAMMIRMTITIYNDCYDLPSNIIAATIARHNNIHLIIFITTATTITMTTMTTITTTINEPIQFAAFHQSNLD